MPKNLFYPISNLRIGDLVAASACFKWLSQCQHDFKLFVDEHTHYHQEFPALTLFSGLITGIVKPSATRHLTKIQFGPLWIRAPWLAKRQIYPEIQIHADFTAPLCKRFPWLHQPFICVHILEDADYNSQRNHDFDNMQQLITALDKQGHTIVRIGLPTQRKASHCIDLSRDSLSLMDISVLLKHCTGYVGGDTGPTHIAGAVSCNSKILAIYGQLEGTQKAYWLEESKKMGCANEQPNFCSLPCVPPVRLTALEMNEHKFCVDEALEKLEHFVNIDN